MMSSGFNECQSSTWGRRHETFIVCFFVFTFLAVPIIAVALTIYTLLYSSLRWLAMIYLTWMWYDYDFFERGGRPWDWMRDHPFWYPMASYFPLQLVKTADLDPKRNYLIGWHPHGVISLGAVVTMCTNGAGFTRLFPGLRRYLATLNMHFKQPLRRDFVASFGVIGASGRALSSVLARPEGGNVVALVVGGAEEALESHAHNYRLCINRRKGFVKVALTSGAHLVPAYAFGETSTFAQVPNPKGSRLRAVQSWIKDKVGLSPVLARGTGFVEGSFGILPYRTKLSVVVGAPIPVDKTERPTLEQVDQLHALYKTNLKRLFDEHKHNYGIPDEVSLEFY